VYRVRVKANRECGRRSARRRGGGGGREQNRTTKRLQPQAPSSSASEWVKTCSEKERRPTEEDSIPETREETKRKRNQHGTKLACRMRLLAPTRMRSVTQVLVPWAYRYIPPAQCDNLVMQFGPTQTAHGAIARSGCIKVAYKGQRFEISSKTLRQPLHCLLFVEAVCPMREDKRVDANEMQSIGQILERNGPARPVHEPCVRGAGG